MICYRDITFCASKVDRHTCNRQLTDEDQKKANELGLPIAWAEFCEENQDAE